jgi:glutamate dehydrogenase
MVGVGDMSGDVFGNGALREKTTRLLAAFDHRDIFVDPDPDPAKSFAERARLFALPRSSWQDYDKKLISKGGGIFPRSLKSIPVSKEIAALTGLEKAEVTPNELIAALIKSECELLWFGGIGNYIKARAETNADVGDKTNDILRADAEDVRALVVGEGANLGVTQKGRIAFARNGGRINTDAIDNSAGVDTSDHEVNIKILLTAAIRAGALKAEKRDKLLESMTDEVGELVLEDNYNQTGALSIAQASAAADLDSHERFIQRLESEGKLVRRVEGLPLTSEFAVLRNARLGLTRPELSKLVAYSKINLFDTLVSSRVPDDPAFEAPLKGYFPRELGKFEKQMKSHRLRREIIATQLADDLVNRCGPSFVDRIKDISRVKTVTVACAFEASRRIFDLEALLDRINALDNKVPAAAQIALHQRVTGALRRSTVYLSRKGRFEDEDPPSIVDVVALYRAPVDAQRAMLQDDLSEIERHRVETRRTTLIEVGAPEDLAEEAALLSPLTLSLDVADMARGANWDINSASMLHCVIGAAFGLDALRDAAMSIKLDQHWDRLVVRRAAEDFGETQLKLSEAAANAIGAPPKDADYDWANFAAKEWIATLGQPATRALSAFADLNSQGAWTFAKLMLISAEFNGLVASLR